MPTNNFLPFCPTDTGSNLLNDADYSASTGRTAGNVPGVASSKLNNKALRQASYIASAVAQLMVNRTGTDAVDDATPAKIIAQLTAALAPLAPVFTSHLSGSGTHNLTYYIFCASANATAGATYTNNGQTFTVTSTIAAGTILQVTGTGAPSLSGVLTKSAGTGDATITFYAIRAPLVLALRAVGGGGGGSGSGSATAGNGGNGGNTTFGTCTAGGGTGGTWGVGGSAPGTGGTPTLGAGYSGVAIAGGEGGGSGYQVNTSNNIAGGMGAPSAFGGGTGKNSNAAANSGSGGAGATVGASAGNTSGSGGGAGAFLDAKLLNPTGNFAWAIGSGGAGGTLGTGGIAGTAGAAGAVYTEERFQ